MPQISVRLSDPLVSALDAAANQQKRSRAGIIRRAIELYLEDHEDLALSIDRLRDPNDPVLDWDEVKNGSLPSD